MTRKLTAKQAEVLGFIESYMSENTFAPSLKDICANFGWKSDNSAYLHVCALARKGAIEVIGGMSRGIRLPSKPHSCPHCGGEVPSIGRAA